jgi:hypothetical protein
MLHMGASTKTEVPLDQSPNLTRTQYGIKSDQNLTILKSKNLDNFLSTSRFSDFSRHLKVGL